MTNSKFKIFDGSKEWFNDRGQFHRLDGPAYERKDGSNFWFANGELHREDGPAGEYTDGTKMWYLNGKPHRLDGPAVEHADGTKDWYINGRPYLKREFPLAVIELLLGCDAPSAEIILKQIKIYYDKF
jgi:hypothetical protein